jgi:hypothetical protein
VTEREMLMDLVADADRIAPNWGDALRRAGFVRGRLALAGAIRPRRLVALAAVVLLAIFAVSAVASERPRRPVYWLFDRSDETYPTIQLPTRAEWRLRERAGRNFVRTKKGFVPKVERVPVLEGSVAGHRWEMLAFLDERGLLNVGLNPGGTPPPYHGTDVPAFIGGASAGWHVRWIAGGTDAEDHAAWWSTYIPERISDGGVTGPKWHFGPAAPNVTHVDLENDDGSVVRVRTFPGPPNLGAPTRLWVAVLRLDHLVHTIVPRDKDGNALEHWHLEIAQ